MNTLDAIQVNDPNNLDEVFAAMRNEMLSGEEYPLQPLTVPEPPQSDPEPTNDQRHHEREETPPQSTCEADAAATASGTAHTSNMGSISRIGS